MRLVCKTVFVIPVANTFENISSFQKWYLDRFGRRGDGILNSFAKSCGRGVWDRIDRVQELEKGENQKVRSGFTREEREIINMLPKAIKKA